MYTQPVMSLAAFYDMLSLLFDQLIKSTGHKMGLLSGRTKSVSITPEH